MKTVKIDESKSMANRLLILASFRPDPLPVFKTRAKDVVELHACLKDFLQGQVEFHVTEGGTTFRFLLSRISRKPGRYKIFAGERLLSRPHRPLYEALKQLGVEVLEHSDSIELISSGWQDPGRPLIIDCGPSTQFASALLLSSKDLPFDLRWDLQNLEKSLPYWQMTEALFRAPTLPACEPDLSSAFSVAALGAVSQGVKIADFPKTSLQADFAFVEFLRAMGIGLEFQGGLTVSAGELKPVTADLAKAPDLLPVLAALCSLAAGTSVLKNIEHVRYKESDRLAKSVELIELSGGNAYEKNGDLFIEGPAVGREPFEFDPDQDHRMAMAAAILQQAGIPVHILHPRVVEKSFPDFWRVVEELK